MSSSSSTGSSSSYEFVPSDLADGYTYEYEVKCEPADAECPCGEGEDTCTLFDLTWCQPNTTFGGEGCPQPCADDEQTCSEVDYDTDGNAVGMEPSKCVKLDVACTCGKNAQSCSYTDEEGVVESYCIPTMFMARMSRARLTAQETSPRFAPR